MKARGLRQTMASAVVTVSVSGLILASGAMAQAEGLSANTLGANHASAHTVFIPGTGNPGETGSTNAGREYVVPYAADPPILGNYAASVNEGSNGAAAAVTSAPSGSDVSIGGYSQGGQAARQASNQPGVATDYNLTVVTTGDPCTEGTGILWRSPQAQMAAGIPCSSLPPNVHGVVINRADDPISNFPEKLTGITVVNAFIAYSYHHSGGYGPVDLSRSDVRSYTVGNVTYVTIPKDQTPALVQFARDHGIYVSPEIEKMINDEVAQPDPGPQGAFVPAASPASPLVNASAPASMSVASPLAEAAAMVDDVFQAHIVEPFVEQVETFANAGRQPVVTQAPAMLPTGNVQVVTDAVKTVAPPEVASVVDQIAVGVQNSPLGGFLNGLPAMG
jgi:hypothetical protein